MSDQATEATASLLDHLAELFAAKRDAARERSLAAETPMAKHWHRGAASAFNECAVECGSGANFMRGT